MCFSIRTDAASDAELSNILHDGTLVQPFIIRLKVAIEGVNLPSFFCKMGSYYTLFVLFEDFWRIMHIFANDYTFYNWDNNI